MSANEASAIAVLSTVTSTQIEYMLSCGNGAYAATFESLLAGVPGASSAVADLGGSPTPPKFGYEFTLQSGNSSTPGPLDCRGRPTTTQWFATALPQTYGTTGTRSFAATAEGVWANSTGAAPEEPFEPPAMRIR